MGLEILNTQNNTYIHLVLEELYLSNEIMKK